MPDLNETEKEILSSACEEYPHIATIGKDWSEEQGVEHGTIVDAVNNLEEEGLLKKIDEVKSPGGNELLVKLTDKGNEEFC